jgi:hypothetical protein
MLADEVIAVAKLHLYPSVTINSPCICVGSAAIGGSAIKSMTLHMLSCDCRCLMTCSCRMTIDNAIQAVHILMLSALVQMISSN